MIIIETHIFTRRIKELMGDDEYKALQEALVNRPDMGAIIRALEKSAGRWKDRAKVVVLGRSTTG